jgi:hypothetical protein
MVRSVGPLRFWRCVERSAEIIAAAASVNESKTWNLFNQIPLIHCPKKRG